MLFACFQITCNRPASNSNDVNATNVNNQPCPLGMELCDGECVMTQLDDRHCGGCNQPCPAYASCDGTGFCELSCPPGMEECAGTCVILATDTSHCGKCDHPCATNVSCVDGQCDEMPCMETVSEAEEVVLPADIVIVVDNSSSMWDEAASVQAPMQDFVGILQGSGIDAHVIMISADSTAEVGVCVPAPVGSGECPADENLPVYRHVVWNVGSKNALELILVTHPDWVDSLRPGATKNIVVISDDNSSMGAADFSSAMVALDPTFTDFRFYAIVSPYNIGYMDCLMCEMEGTCNTSGCDTCCGKDSLFNLLCTPLPASEGTVYRELIAATGGIEGNLCLQDFLPVFHLLATAVVGGSRVACSYEIPEPPDGELLDYGRINVDYQENPDILPEPIFFVPGGAEACGPDGGWYYDDADFPTRIIFCSVTCEMVTSSPEAIIKVKYGCDTIIG